MSKKTESIEIRVSPELKAELARVSAGKGRSMSETLRNLIEGEVAGRGQPQPQIGETIMPTSFFTRATRAALFSLPVLALAGVYLLSAQAPAAAHAEIRIFFAEVDGDGDNRITLPEVEMLLQDDAWQAEPDCAASGEPCTLADYAQFHFNRADADGSGDVTYAEFEAVNLRDWAEDFLNADADENGVLTVDEMVADWLLWAVEVPDELQEDGVTLSAACRARIDAEQVVGIAEACDLAHEGRLRIAEFDANRDGRVTLAEYLRQ